MQGPGGQIEQFGSPLPTGRGRKTRDVQQLVAAEHAARVAGESAARWWQDLAETSASARTDRVLDALFRSSFATMKAALDADAVSVLVANEAGNELIARASNGLSEEVTLRLGIRAGEGMSGRVIATRKPLLVDDLSTIEVVSPVLRNSGLRSVAAVPILFDERVLGVLYVASLELSHFDELDVELLELMAERLAVALERVQAFESERAARLRAERDADHLSRLQARHLEARHRDLGRGDRFQLGWLPGKPDPPARGDLGPRLAVLRGRAQPCARKGRATPRRLAQLRGSR